MANSFILLADLKAKCCSNSAEVCFAEVWVLHDSHRFISHSLKKSV
ncbi:BnaC09g13790D [Brassica napus]|uniref:BnaC09g13790D protein n=3 Tax=Brassica TaxID=3705 RepID=A0A078G263_BRANA|nr:BnaC09g13790D [Brassica napus]